MKVRLNGKVVGLTKLGKKQRMTGLLRAVLKVMSSSLYIFSLPLKLPD
jgi:hypothetical protein